MNTDHKHIAHYLNQRQEIMRENARREKADKALLPFFVCVYASAAIVVALYLLEVIK